MEEYMLTNQIRILKYYEDCNYFKHIVSSANITGLKFFKEMDNDDYKEEIKTILKKYNIYFSKNEIKGKIETMTEKEVLLLGKTRTGKSTIYNVIKDLGYIVPPLTLFSTTRKVTKKHKPIIAKFDENNYVKLKLYDTPGLHDIQANDNKQSKLNDEQILEMINNKVDIENIDKILFTFSLESGIIKGEIYSILKYLLYFSNPKKETIKLADKLITYIENNLQKDYQEFDNKIKKYIRNEIINKSILILSHAESKDDLQKKKKKN